MEFFVFIMTPPDAVDEICLIHRFETGEWTFLLVPFDYTPAKNYAPLSSFLYFQSRPTLERDLLRAYGTGILYKQGFNGLRSR